MYLLTSYSAPAFPHVLGAFETVADAQKAITRKIVLIEEDAEYPDHYDAIDASGTVYTIEPVKQDSQP